MGSRSGARSAPAGHGALLGDGVTPHGEAHAHDGAGDEDQEDHEGADQQAQAGVEEGAATRVGGRHRARLGPQHPCSARRRRGATPALRFPAGLWAQGTGWGQAGSLPFPERPSPHSPPAQPVLPKPRSGAHLIAETGPLFKGKSTWFQSIEASSHTGGPDRLSWRLTLTGTHQGRLPARPSAQLSGTHTAGHMTLL